MEIHVETADIEKKNHEKNDILIILLGKEYQQLEQLFSFSLSDQLQNVTTKTSFALKMGKISPPIILPNGALTVFVGIEPITDDYHLEKFRITGGVLSDKLKDSMKKGTKVGIVLDSSIMTDEMTRAFLEGLLLKTFQDSYLKTREKEKLVHPLTEAHVTFYIPNKTQLSTFSKKIHETEIICKWTNYARSLSNLPPNIATPSYIANKAIENSKNLENVEVKVLSEEECRALGMGSFLGVAQGTDEPAKFVIIEYKPKNAKNTKPYVFVGKGITFDSGGITLKKGQGMELMKHDMQGAAVVHSTVFCAAELQLPFHIIGITPLTENLPSGKAYKPADVVKTLDGKTIEIISTDSEGRMILVDALTYAATTYDPEWIIDIATLTGGMVVALGEYTIGLFSNNDALAEKIISASKKSEKVWRFPLWEEYDNYLKSDVADFKNTAGMKASSINAARLLSHFVKNYPWAHLDIAGTAWNPPSPRNKYLNPGATAAGHRLLTQLLIDSTKNNS